ncbi:hypothetical protein F4809DRAFT_645197 [Biscogniauxia mediterranea]|nr:hypothetical protein F4809DRAFT_645197 [Biscogniauxia mediterranea]
MMNAWDDEAEHRPTFPGLGIGASHSDNGYNDIYIDDHIYEDGLETTLPGTSTRGSHARDKTSSPVKSPVEHIYSHVSLDQDPFQSYQSAAFDPSPLPDPSPGIAHNPLDNTDTLSISSWEEDDGAGNGLLPGGPSSPNDFENHHHYQHHQDRHDELAERIAHLTRTMNAHASTCLEISSRAVDIARENAHLATQAGGALDAYVLRPALRLVGSSSASAMQMLIRTCSSTSDSPEETENGGPGRAGGVEGGVQAIRRECEDRLRRALANCKNGRDMAMIGQTGSAVGMSIRSSLGGREREVSRLKDRLVEQDAVLRDSSRHIRRLMWERDRLRKQLESGHHVRAGANRPTKAGKASDFEEAIVRGSTPTALGNMRARAMTVPQGAGPYIGESGLQNEDEEEARSRERQLTAQLEELRVLMDQMALHEVNISNLNNNNNNNNSSSNNGGQRRSSASSVASSSSSFSSSFVSAPEDEEKEQEQEEEKKKKRSDIEKNGGGRTQQKQPKLPRRQPLRRQQKKQKQKQQHRAPHPPPPSFDMEHDPEDPEWTLL